MKRFVAASLVLAILVNSSTASFALSANVTSDLCSATLKKSSTYPWASKDMQAGCLGIIEVKIKDPGTLMQNSEMQVKLNEEPLRYGFNPFNLSTFLRKTPVRKEVNKFQLDGVRKKAAWYNIPERLLNWLLDRRVPVDYRIVPISKEEARPFLANNVNQGDKKAEVKANEDFLKNILEKNGKSKMAELSEELLERAIRGLNDGKVDPYDTYNTVEKGTIFQYANYKEPLDTLKYYSKKEADDKNKQMALQRTKICDGFGDKSESELKKYGLMTTLSAEKPIQHFAIVVNNKIDGKPEAYKLFNLLASNGYDFLNNDTSVLEFDCKTAFKMPEGGKPANKEKLAEVEALIDSTKEKPGMRQWFKNLGNLTLKSIESVLPQFVSDAFKAFWSSVSNKFSKASGIMSKVGTSVPAPVQPGRNNVGPGGQQQQQQQQQQQAPAAPPVGNNGGQGGQPQPAVQPGGNNGGQQQPAAPQAQQQAQPGANQPMVVVNVNGVPQGQNGNNVVVQQQQQPVQPAQPAQQQQPAPPVGNN